MQKNLVHVVNRENFESIELKMQLQTLKIDISKLSKNAKNSSKRNS